MCYFTSIRGIGSHVFKNCNDFVISVSGLTFQLHIGAIYYKIQSYKINNHLSNDDNREIQF